MTENTPAPQRKRPWLRRMLGIGAALLLFYLGYCWGWWFRDNLLVQAIFQCACPPVSEAARYAPFRVVASACSAPGVRISPTGHTMALFETQPPPRRISLLRDAATIRTPLPIDPSIIGADFLTDDLLYGYKPGQSYLIDLQAQPPRVVPIPRFTNWRQAMVSERGAGILYINNNTVVFVVRDQPEQSAFLVEPDDDSLKQWAKDHHTPLISLDHPRDNARDHPWQANRRGIWDTTTNQMLVPTYDAQAPTPSFSPSGWFAGDRGVVYTYAKTKYLIPGGTGSPLTPPLNFFYVPQPILALDVPEELLSATPTTTP